MSMAPSRSTLLRLVLPLQNCIVHTVTVPPSKYMLEGGGAGLADGRLVSVVLQAWVIGDHSQHCKSESSSDTNVLGTVAVLVSITSVESSVPSRRNIANYEALNYLEQGSLNLNQTWLLWFAAHLEQSIEHKMHAMQPLKWFL